ncbi:UDP-N-acetylmuramoyl-L-alanyl-D-glutamate--2,6-diaminopimelate ligase [Candidatus Falkowbacteria bacterium]|nr:UDP-N-acetylmuramoyl-L-alanyl-D-glutamate--2,6-diaminopimelate ligase [Candidatus Falkowbacteria bacterium]
MKSLLKKLIPKPLIQLYHYLLANLAVLVYLYPSRKMIVIGITGTKGKSTTSYLIYKMLEHAGFKVGLSSTIMFKAGDREWLNNKKMTMIGRFQLQKLLSQMVKVGCQYAVVETSSEGIAQYRHLGIDYDILVFTGLTPEHIEAHGSFENYKNTKLKIFRDLEKRKNKKLTLSPEGEIRQSRLVEVKKIIVANTESEHAKDFLNFNVNQKISYSLNNEQRASNNNQKELVNVQWPALSKTLSLAERSRVEGSMFDSDSSGIKFKVNNVDFKSRLLGQFNILNSLAAVSVGLSQNLGLDKISKALKSVTSVPGRMEVVYNKNFKVIVDYAHEPNSMERVYKEVSAWPHNKIITVFGGTGGGRDKSKRPKMGALAAKYCDTIILTTDDPYQDDVIEISNNIENGIKNVGANCHSPNKKLFKIINRKEAIEKAINIAESDDIILILGKGSEQKIALKDGYHNWDDREVVKNIFKSSNS